MGRVVTASCGIIGRLRRHEFVGIAVSGVGGVSYDGGGALGGRGGRRVLRGLIALGGGLFNFHALVWVGYLGNGV